MDKPEDIQKAVDAVQNSNLDQTIKDILIRDIHQEGLTPFITEQLKFYCNYEYKETSENS